MRPNSALIARPSSVGLGSAPGPRRYQRRPWPIDDFVKFIEQRGPEVGWNGVVLFRELAAIGFAGSYQQVQRFLKPYRAPRKWSELATVRFETEPGEQAQVDYGQLRFRATVYMTFT